MTFRQRLLRLLPPAATTLFFYPSYSVASCGLVKPTDKEALRRQQAAYVTAIYSGNASSRKMMAKEFPSCNPSTMEKWAAALSEDLGNTAERATLSRAALEYCGCDATQARHDKIINA